MIGSRCRMTVGGLLVCGVVGLLVPGVARAADTVTAPAASAAAGQPLKDVETVTPKGPYELLTLTLVKADPKDGDVMVQIPLRGGKMVIIPFEPALKEGIGHVLPMAGNSRARIMDTGLDFGKSAVNGKLGFQSWGTDWGGAIKAAPLVFDGTVALTRTGDAVTGTHAAILLRIRSAPNVMPGIAGRLRME